MEDIEDIMRMDKEKLAAPIKTIEVNPLTIHHTLFNSLSNKLPLDWFQSNPWPLQKGSHCTSWSYITANATTHPFLNATHYIQWIPFEQVWYNRQNWIQSFGV